MAILTRAGKVLTRGARWALSRCRALCCGGCRTYYRFRDCPNQEQGVCGSSDIEWYLCASSTCEGGGGIVGRVLYLPDSQRCVRSVDAVLYHAPGQPVEGAQPPAGEGNFDNAPRVYRCVDSCQQAPCPPENYAAMGQACNPQAQPAQPVAACLTWLDRCGVYEYSEGVCLKFDPATARPVSELLSAYPDLDVLLTPPSVRRDECCGCGSCPGGTVSIPPVCDRGEPVELTCCCPEPFQSGPCRFWGRVSVEASVHESRLLWSGDRTDLTLQLASANDTAPDCTSTRTGTIRRRFVQTNAGEAPVVVYDFTNPALWVDGPECHGQYLAALGRNMPEVGLVALANRPFEAACQGQWVERFGCLNYEFDFNLSRDTRGQGTGELLTVVGRMRIVMRLEGDPSAPMGCDGDCLEVGAEDVITLPELLGTD